MGLKRSESGILNDELVGILFGREVRFVDVPAELFFVAFSFEFQVKMDRNEDFLSFGGSFLPDVVDIGG